MKQREMRKENNSLSWEDTIQILKTQQEGVLGINGFDGYPYCVPMNYVFDDNKIVIHSAAQGYKLDCLNTNSRVSFSVYNVLEVKETTSNWESAMVFGQAEIIHENQAKEKYMQMLVSKFGGTTPSPFPPNLLNLFVIITIKIEEFSGKLKNN